MPKASRHSTPTRDNEAATLWADLGEGVKNYRRMKRDDRIAFETRQLLRRIEARRISTAPLVGGKAVAGYPWREAWLVVQTMLLIDNRLDEMEGPQEWMQRKLRNRLKNDG